MSNLGPTQNSGERVVLDLRPHWWYFMPQFLALALSFAFYLLIEFLFDPSNRLILLLVIAPFVISSVLLAVRFVTWITTSFVLTTDRLKARSGFIKRQGIEIPLERVNTVFFSQTIFERVIGSGDLVIESAGEQGQQKFSDIRKPLVVQNQIHLEMEANADRRYSGGSTSAGAEDPDVFEQIDKLDDLRKRGLITPEEFEIKKDELLGRL